MAFGCGVTRISSVVVQSDFADYSGSWHQDVAHKHEEPGPQALLFAANRACFQATTLDLAAKLDAFEDSPGVSVLLPPTLNMPDSLGTAMHEVEMAETITRLKSFSSAASRCHW